MPKISIAEWDDLEQDAPTPPPVPVIFEVDLIAYLAAAIGVPVWPGVIPAGVTRLDLPALVYNLISEDSEDDLSGPTDLCMWTVQLDSYGLTRHAASALIESLKAKLHGYRGRMGRTWVESAGRTDGSTAFEESATSSGLLTQRRMAQYWICFRESVPTFPPSQEIGD
jgi:hypothetical protein